jgi:hypothetical protein
MKASQFIGLLLVIGALYMAHTYKEKIYSSSDYKSIRMMGSGSDMNRILDADVKLDEKDLKDMKDKCVCDKKPEGKDGKKPDDLKKETKEGPKDAGRVLADPAPADIPKPDKKLEEKSYDKKGSKGDKDGPDHGKMIDGKCVCGKKESKTQKLIIKVGLMVLGIGLIGLAVYCCVKKCKAKDSDNTAYESLCCCKKAKNVRNIDNIQSPENSPANAARVEVNYEAPRVQENANYPPQIQDMGAKTNAPRAEFEYKRQESNLTVSNKTSNSQVHAEEAFTPTP